METKSSKSIFGRMFKNRAAAGEALASAFLSWDKRPAGRGVIIGLLRGGLVVAQAMAKDLSLPLDFRTVRKIGHPANPEYAIGAVDISGQVERSTAISLDEVSEAEFQKLSDQTLIVARELDGESRFLYPTKIDKASYLVITDDGAATGLTLLAAVRGLRQVSQKPVYVALPVASNTAAELLRPEADGTLVLQQPLYFAAVGQFYEDFPQVSTEEVKQILKTAL